MGRDYTLAYSKVGGRKIPHSTSQFPVDRPEVPPRLEIPGFGRLNESFLILQTLQQFGHADPESLGHSFDARQTRLFLTILQLAEIAHVHADSVGKFLLRPLPFPAQFSQAFAEPPPSRIGHSLSIGDSLINAP